jgi:hypothetical protein
MTPEQQLSDGAGDISEPPRYRQANWLYSSQGTR